MATKNIPSLRELELSLGGRPTASVKRDQRIYVYLTRYEHACLKNAATKAGTTISEYIRGLILKKL